MLTSPGPVCVRSALARLLPGALTPTPLALADLFADRLEQYAEIIVGPGAAPVGFMTRGEDSVFTERAQIALEQLGMPRAALEHHRAMAAWFEHKRAFLKLEWHASDADRAEPLAACYFRRRPSIATTIERLSEWGVCADARELVGDVAAAVDKQTIHFVSAAFRPDRTVQHKLYFSLYLTPATRAQVRARIGRVFERFGLASSLREQWRDNHERCVLFGESTLFLSISFSADEVTPSFKIDYPRVSPDSAAAWLPGAQRRQVVTDAARAQALAGSSSVTFLGVRFHADRAVPDLKYYCDIPSTSP